MKAVKALLPVLIAAILLGIASPAHAQTGDNPIHSLTAESTPNSNGGVNLEIDFRSDVPVSYSISVATDRAFSNSIAGATDPHYEEFQRTSFDNGEFDEGEQYWFHIDAEDENGNEYNIYFTIPDLNDDFPYEPHVVRSHDISVSENSATVTFETDGETFSAVEYGPADSWPANNQVIDPDTRTSNHQITMDGLDKDTKYFYRLTVGVGSADVLWPSSFAVSSFTTSTSPPQPGDGDDGGDDTTNPDAQLSISNLAFSDGGDTFQTAEGDTHTFSGGQIWFEYTSQTETNAHVAIIFDQTDVVRYGSSSADRGTAIVTLTDNGITIPAKPDGGAVFTTSPAYFHSSEVTATAVLMDASCEAFRSLSDVQDCRQSSSIAETDTITLTIPDSYVIDDTEQEDDSPPSQEDGQDTSNTGEHTLSIGDSIEVSGVSITMTDIAGDPPYVEVDIGSTTGFRMQEGSSKTHDGIKVTAIEIDSANNEATLEIVEA